MKRIWRGFTLIEVSLFLAITAAVFVGIAVGTSNSIFQQRYNDTVQNFVEFLRSIYSQVTNVQSESTGRSEKAIYGKLVTFENVDGENRIRTYNVIGNLENSTTGTSGGNVLEKLEDLEANVIIEKTEGVYSSVGFVDDYVPKWSAQIQNTDAWNSGYKLFTGMLLIVRNPSSGTVHTYVSYSNPPSYDDYLEELNSGITGDLPTFPLDTFIKSEVDFCINPNGASKSNLRRDVRIVAGAKNVSGIEIISDNNNQCK